MKVDRNILTADLNKRAAIIWEALCEIHPRLVKHDVPEVRLNGRMWRCAGQAFLASDYITISPKFYDAGFSTRMNKIILPHELIHMADWYLFGASEKKCGHGKNWAKIMVELGLPANKYHSLIL